MVDQSADDVALLRRELRSAIAERARLIHAVYLELSEEMSAAEAVELMRRAVYKMGLGMAPELKARFGDRQLSPMELVETYVRTSPDRGRIFPLRYRGDTDGSCSADTLACPIKDLMEGLGVPQSEFTAVAHIFDGGVVGMLEGLGFRVETELPELGADICCRITIRSAH